MGRAILYEKLAITFPKRVYFEGSTALPRGIGLCYNSDYGTDTSADQRRYVRVELPSPSNNLCFAGVTQKAYMAVTGGQWIGINEPGSVCPVWVNLDTVVNATYMTCSATTGVDAGCFTYKGHPGRGTILALQTVTGVSLTGEIDGTGSLASDGLTLTGTGFTKAMEGDYVYILAGEKQNAVVAAIVEGRYVIETYNSATEVVLSSVASDASAATTCSYYVSKSARNYTCLAKLQDGPESGLQEWVSGYDADAVAMTIMTGGFTQFSGNYTYGTNATATLGTACPFGTLKSFRLGGAISGQDILISAAGTKGDGTTDSTTHAFDGDGDATTLMRTINGWSVISSDGTGET